VAAASPLSIKTLRASAGAYAIMAAMTLPQLYTMKEVAERLHKSLRWLQNHLRENPCGRRAGKTLLFTDEDFARMVAGLPKDGERVVRRRRHAPNSFRMDEFLHPRDAVAEGLALANSGKRQRARNLRIY